MNFNKQTIGDGVFHSLSSLQRRNEELMNQCNALRKELTTERLRNEECEVHVAIIERLEQSISDINKANAKKINKLEEQLYHLTEQNLLLKTNSRKLIAQVVTMRQANEHFKPSKKYEKQLLRAQELTASSEAPTTTTVSESEGQK